VALLAVPPYLLEGRTPDYVRGSTPLFHRAAFQLAAPVDFPRPLFTGVLREHARLVDRHAAEVMAAPLDRPWFEVGHPEDVSRHVEIVALPRCTSVLVAEGSVVQIHRWRTAQASWVLQRCRGIVRKLMLRPPAEHTHLVVIAGGVASMHVMRGVPPRRAGDTQRLEVVQRDVVVEPWDQWHRRRRGHVVTWWRTPAGELAASRVAAPLEKDDGREACEALLRIYRDELRAAFAGHEPMEPGAKPLVIMRSSRNGEDIDVTDRDWAEHALREYPTLLAALGSAPPGFAPIVVDIFSDAVLQWCPVGALDVATPPLVHATDDRPAAPDEYDVAFDEPPPVRYARIPDWSLWLQLGWMVFVSGLSVVGMVVLLALTVVPWIVPDHVAWAARWFDVLAPIVFLVWVHDYGIMALPIPDEPPLPTPRRRTRYTGRKFWMNRLSQRLSRHERLAEVGAPEGILQDSADVVRGAIAQLDPRDAEAVLRAWPRAARMVAAGPPAEVGRDERLN
jgi:hypothetical protein